MTRPIAWGGSSLPLPSREIKKIDPSKVDPKVMNAAKKMESMFLDVMFKEMRKTVPKSEMSLESPASQMYRQMLDSEIAQKAAGSNGVGLAEQIVAYLQGAGYNVYRDSGAQRSPQEQSMPSQSVNRTGGTHED